MNERNSGVRPWDEAPYQRIVEASGQGHDLSVRFENGDEIAFDVRRLADTSDEVPDWSQLATDGFELTFPADGKTVELPWLQIRTLFDQDFAGHLARHAEQEASQVGHQLRLLREQRGLSAREVADRAGIAPQSLSRIERGRHDVVFSKVRLLLATMNYDLTDLARVGAAGVDADQVLRALGTAGLDQETVERILFGADEPRSMLGRVSNIFGWSPTDMAGPGAPPALATPALIGRFKQVARDRGPGSTAYVVYAYRLATLVEKATDRPEYTRPPDQPQDFAAEVRERYGNLSFESVARYLWDHGIPILPLQDRGQFHGACWLIEGRPVIVLKQRLTYNSRWVFDLCHEICHVLKHLSPDEPAVIEFDEIGRNHEEEEEEASEFAGEVLLGDPHSLAQRAVDAAGGKGERLKSVLPGFAAREGVDLGVLANYLAHRLSDQGLGQAFWGVAANFQSGDDNALEIAVALLELHVDWERLDDDERLVLEGALRPRMEAQ